MLLISPHHKGRLQAWPSFFFFHSPPFPLFLSVYFSLIISLRLFLSPCVYFIRQKQGSHITGTPEGYEKSRTEEKFQTKCRREPESVCVRARVCVMWLRGKKKGDARDVIKERMIFLSDVLSACACRAADPRVFACVACIYARR